ncbi:MAG: hypothetical protein H6741_00150 [Alphaproteobacteria bacterium]|nr:hypothetical protein [Alphaproteobacteria bacterium]MCB9791115.1 hypothetical protein [Alphaproteobacteria bacterium]
MIALAFAAGFLGGAAHLGVTALRARAVTGGSVGLSLLLAPAGLAGPALATVAVLLWHPAGVWALLVGLIAARGLLIRRLGRAVEGGAWRP